MPGTRTNPEMQPDARKNLRLAELPEMEDVEIPWVTPEELDKICNLDISEDEIRAKTRYINISQNRAILNNLCGRNIKKELPIEEETFSYKRNLEECQKLKNSVFRLLDSKTAPDDSSAADATKLFILEKRKAEWLEHNFYPALYDRAINTARGEVTQFLIKQKNAAELDQFPEVDNIDINLKDELTYLTDNTEAPLTAGLYKGYSIDINVPDYYNASDEWKIYLVAVHELLHHASFKNEKRQGLKQRYSDPNYEELNEAVTQIMTFIIARNHLSKLKTPLINEQKNLHLGDMAYSTYTFLVKNVMEKIPMKFFTDAMLNEAGLDRLSDKFEEVYGGKLSLTKFAGNLQDYYTPKKKQ